MLRYWLIAAVALLPVSASITQAGGKKGSDNVKIEGKLTQDDPKDKKRNTPCQIHRVKMKKGRAYTIDMESSNFDSFLRLLSPKGAELAEDDDSGGNLNARIIFQCPKDGEYQIVCTSYQANIGMGNYTLLVRSGPQQQDTAGHATLLNKPASDFQGDFAVNGQPVKLSDLKGKVVLLEFWEPRSQACANLFPKLLAWNKAYKGEGLEIVGVTYYLHEIGQKLGFDKETGKLKDVDKAGKETDQALLREFAAYHRLDYPLMALPRADAVKAYDAFVVNGLPQAVLIDRQGIIRLIHVGDDETGSAALEKTLKSLLADKAAP
jgi:thiol-disulfide isomerase/thioredoxin